MHPYWLLFLVPAFLALIGDRRNINHLTNKFSTKIDPLWFSVIFVLTMVIGFRYYVGGPENSVGTVAGTMKIEIASDSIGSNILATGYYRWEMNGTA